MPVPLLELTHELVRAQEEFAPVGTVPPLMTCAATVTVALVEDVLGEDEAGVLTIVP